MLYTLVVVLFFYGTCFSWLSTRVENTTFCINDAEYCPLLRHLEGNRNTVMNTLFVNLMLSISDLFLNLINILKGLWKAIQENPETHDFVKRCVQLH
jgi:hypothetical protein